MSRYQEAGMAIFPCAAGLCSFNMFFLDVAPSKKHVYKSEMQLAPMQEGQVISQVPVSFYGTGDRRSSIKGVL